MVVDKKTKVGEFIQFPLDYSDEQCLKEYGLTLDQYDDAYGYLYGKELMMYIFLFQAAKDQPQRKAKYEEAKQKMLESIARRKAMTPT